MHELSNRQVKTRKCHPCCWCGEMIPKGALAQARSYIWEDGPQSDWMHIECYEAMSTLPTAETSDGWLPGDFARGAYE